VAEFCAAVSAELQGRGGTQVKTIGDALMLTVPEPGAAVLLGLRIVDELMLVTARRPSESVCNTGRPWNATATTSAPPSTWRRESRRRPTVAKCC
jgi:hypothetical protein